MLLALALALNLGLLVGCGTASAPRAAPAPVSAAPPVAPAPAPPAATTAAPVAFGLSGDTPDGRVHARVAPGGHAELAFRLANAGDAPASFVLTAAHTGAGAWLSAPATVSVPPRESVRVVAALSVPSGTPPGLHEGALVAAARTGPPALAAGSGASVSYRVAARVTVTVGAGAP